MNHSIPDALAVAVRTAAGTVLHTGDFKMDQLPLDGRITDLRAFARLGEEGVDLFMVDSTNAEVPGFVAQERGIGPVLDQVFADSTKRIIVASFASHVHRVQQVLDAALRARPPGRARRPVDGAQHGHRRPTSATSRCPRACSSTSSRSTTLRDDEIVLMCTGSQGEPMAALSRIANNDHKVSVGPGDTVIMASSLIPGNENAVFRVINGLTRLGARVVHSGNAKVHVSGHASAGELLYCYNILKPRNVMPVHGEIRHLVANAALAVQTGVPADRVVLAEDGVVVDLVDGRASHRRRRALRVRVRRRLERRRDHRGRAQGPPDPGRRGLHLDLRGGQLRRRQGARRSADPRPRVRRAGRRVRRHPPGAHRGPRGGRPRTATPTRTQLQQVMRRVVGRWVSNRLRRRPMIIPVVVEA